MYYLTVENEEGAFLNAEGTAVELLSCNEAHTPAGLNCGWTFFPSDKAALAGLGLTEI